MVKNLPAVQETWVQSLGREDTLEKGMAMHSSILSGEFHAQMSLAGYSPRGQKELDMTEQLTLSHLKFYIYLLFFRFFFHIGHYRVLILG